MRSDERDPRSAAWGAAADAPGAPCAAWGVCAAAPAALVAALDGAAAGLTAPPIVRSARACRLLKLLPQRPEIVPFYIGDDITDEDAFRALAGRGVCVAVRDGGTRQTAADYALADVGEVRRFLGALSAMVNAGSEE